MTLCDGSAPLAGAIWVAALLALGQQGTWREANAEVATLLVCVRVPGLLLRLVEQIDDLGSTVRGEPLALPDRHVLARGHRTLTISACPLA